jgi:hypothetical protein
MNGINKIFSDIIFCSDPRGVEYTEIVLIRWFDTPHSVVILITAKLNVVLRIVYSGMYQRVVW